MSWLADAEVETAQEREDKRMSGLKQAIRTKRDKLLTETDHLIMPDYPDKPLGVDAYRQKLRDVTEQKTFPESVVWPEFVQ